jgi:hypothetical protein
MTAKIDIAHDMNQRCSCRTLDTELLIKNLAEYEDLFRTRPNLFSSTMVFISENQLDQIKKIISTVEKIIQNPSYQKSVLEDAPSLSHHQFGPRGVFMGYDFHLCHDGPKLIEINTNAGGALLNARLARSQQECCTQTVLDEKIEEKFVSMFLNEWKLQRPEKTLKTILILDQNPKSQFLYPEFRLFEKLFNEFGLEAFIADPSELAWKNDKLWLNNKCIDLIYNRMTDFYLDEVTNKNIKMAYVAGAVVLTPNPNHHALYANKRNLEVLSDPEKLKDFDLSDQEKNLLLSGIPRTEKIEQEKAEIFWKRRRELFFKPDRGFGSKASYRGDKITRKVWQEILSGHYVAQKIIDPTTRLISIDGKETNLKMDLRVYCYMGQIHLLAARLYQGQTTNFRTSGGGFAPVFVTT